MKVSRDRKATKALLPDEFARVAIEYILDETPIKRVVATAMPENKASNRVLEKAGMRFSDYNLETKKNSRKVGDT